MTDEQFNRILEGSTIATREGLYRLAGLLTGVLGVANDPTDKIKMMTLVDYAVKVSTDLYNGEQKRKEEKK